jgi:type IV pilus assembly protein PilY1
MKTRFAQKARNEKFQSSLSKRAMAAAGALLCALAAQGAETDLSSLPLITSAPQVVKPNIMFIMDDSGSMGWTHMPDDVDSLARTGTGSKKYGYVSSQCNGVYYNPNVTYSPPVSVASNGTITYYADSTFTNAWVNGYNPSGTKVNLSTSFQAWSNSTVRQSSPLENNADTAQAAYYYTYSGSELSQAQKNYFDTSSTFYQECNSVDGNPTLEPGDGKFTKVQHNNPTAWTAAQQTNFANWYSYYRTRMLMMKTATGLAFKNIGDKYRIGYMSINNNVDPSFLNIDTFETSHKSNWYTKLYGASPNNRTPLREALSNAGRIYAKQKTTMYGETVVDPVQYSCQKNFALLSTDGYWNDNAGFQVDGSTAVGNQDADQPAPFNDGGSVSNVYRGSVTITGWGFGSKNVTSIKVDGLEILKATASAGSSSSLASAVVTQINACTIAPASGNCQIAGYSAVRSGSKVTITAPAAVSGSPAALGTASVTYTAFTSASVTTGGTSDTLADVAQYYYRTDLRTPTSGDLGALGNSVSTNNVLPGGDDDATWQHMTTFTLGLGARGRMVYSSTYKSDTTGDYAAIANELTASGAGGNCPWQSTGTCTWPTPGDDLPENIDDLWHAAVNGRGQYFAASDPTSLGVGLNSALQSVTAMTSDSAAATTSNPNVTAGDNYLFSSTFRSAEWYGDLERRQIDTTTGLPAATADWTAADQLDAKASRTIYTFDASATNKLKPFAWASLSGAEQAYFSTAYVQSTASPPLSQFCASGIVCLSAAAQTAAGGQPLVDFIRGDRTNEGTVDNTAKYFRQRIHLLGDIVNSEAVYVKKPQYDYVDTGYATFTSDNASRTAMVYVGANDGMLHAFNATTGDETWAYVPKLLMPKLYQLADKFYASNHQYFVDGSPTVGDVYFGGAWHTILVGGFNDGGRGYYALDITDPASPKALWEFTDANMGLSFGRPEITKLANGTWVVLFTSGYNNVNPGNGQGYLYVVNAGTGAAISTIGTGVGSATASVAGVCATAPCPSGLAQIRAWVDNTRYDNTATKVYGGDLYGNLWRFDINGTFGPAGVEAQLLATLRGPGSPGAVQSMTAKPELGKVAGSPVIFVGTGRYLGGSDLNNSEVQSIYAIKDSGGSTSVGSPRADIGATGFVQQTLTDATCGTSTFCTAGSNIRTGTSNPVNFATQKGWFVDLPGARERANTDPQLALGTLAVTTNLLDPSACSVGGTSFINFFDYRTGGPIQGANGMVSVFLGNALATRPVQLKFADGTVRSLVRMSDNSWQTPRAPIPPSGIGTRRTSWRELVVE